MSVSAGDFHEFAQRIAKGATREIDLRNAVSRIYYAAYHECVARLASQGGNIDLRAGHAEFSAQLRSQPADSPLRRLGVALDHLRHRRNIADYGLNRDFAAGEVNTAFGAYNNIKQFLKEAGL